MTPMAVIRCRRKARSGGRCVCRPDTNESSVIALQLLWSEMGAQAPAPTYPRRTSAVVQPHFHAPVGRAPADPSAPVPRAPVAPAHTPSAHPPRTSAGGDERTKPNHAGLPRASAQSSGRRARPAPSESVGPEIFCMQRYFLGTGRPQRPTEPEPGSRSALTSDGRGAPSTALAGQPEGARPACCGNDRHHTAAMVQREKQGTGTTLLAGCCCACMLHCCWIRSRQRQREIRRTPRCGVRSRKCECVSRLRPLDIV